jgi:hypothetical protein
VFLDSPFFFPLSAFLTVAQAVTDSREMYLIGVGKVLDACFQAACRGWFSSSRMYRRTNLAEVEYYSAAYLHSRIQLANLEFDLDHADLSKIADLEASPMSTNVDAAPEELTSM